MTEDLSEDALAAMVCGLATNASRWHAASSPCRQPHDARGCVQRARALSVLVVRLSFPVRGYVFDQGGRVVGRCRVAG